MKNVKKLIYVLAILGFFFSCTNKEKQIKEKEFSVDSLLKDVQVNLEKIDRSVLEKSFSDTVLDKYADNFEKLQKDIDSLLEIAPEDYQLLEIKLGLLSRKNDSLITDFLSKKLAAQANNLPLQYFKGLRIKDFKKSLAYYSKMIENNPNSCLGYLGYGIKIADNSHENLEIPAKLFYLAILKDPKMLQPYYYLSNVFAATNQYDSKAMLDGIILVKNPDDFYAFNSLVKYYMITRDTTKAADIYQVYVKNNPKKLSNEVHARMNLLFSNFEETLNFIEQEKLKNSENNILNYYEARAYLGLNKKEKAFKCLKKFYNNASESERLFITAPDFKNNFMDNPSYQKMLRKVDGPIEGDKAPLLGGKLLEGGFYNPKRYENKVLLIDFWAEWCGPCKREMPNLVEVYKELHSKGFEIVGVNIDKGRDLAKAKEYISQNQIKWQIIANGEGWNDKNAMNFSVNGIPQTYLVDRNGIVRYKSIRGKEDLKKKVEELLKEK